VCCKCTAADRRAAEEAARKEAAAAKVAEAASGHSFAAEKAEKEVHAWIEAVTGEQFKTSPFGDFLKVRVPH
jgi:hypothetical protein